MSKRNIKKADVVWSEQENLNATASALHGYYSNERVCGIGVYTGESHLGNSALCNKKMGVSEDGEIFLPIADVPVSKLNKNAACKRCLRIFDNIV